MARRRSFESELFSPCLRSRFAALLASSRSESSLQKLSLGKNLDIGLCASEFPYDTSISSASCTGEKAGATFSGRNCSLIPFNSSKV